MYEGLRLTELHEERAWLSHLRQTKAATALDAEIRARVAAQEIGIPFLVPGFSLDVARQNFPVPLAFGIPDAERVYPAKRRGIPSPLKIRNMAGEMVPVSELEAFFREWTHHAQHAVPAEGCHLCREGREAEVLRQALDDPNRHISARQLPGAYGDNCALLSVMAVKGLLKPKSVYSEDGYTLTCKGAEVIARASR